MTDFSVHIEAATKTGAVVTVDDIENLAEALSRLVGVDASASLHPSGGTFGATINARAESLEAASGVACADFTTAASEVGLPLDRITAVEANLYADID